MYVGKQVQRGTIRMNSSQEKVQVPMVFAAKEQVQVEDAVEVRTPIRRAHSEQVLKMTFPIVQKVPIVQKDLPQKQGQVPKVSAVGVARIQVEEAVKVPTSTWRPHCEQVVQVQVPGSLRRSRYGIRLCR